LKLFGLSENPGKTTLSIRSMHNISRHKPIANNSMPCRLSPWAAILESANQTLCKMISGMLCLAKLLRGRVGKRTNVHQALREYFCDTLQAIPEIGDHTTKKKKRETFTPVPDMLLTDAAAAGQMGNVVGGSETPGGSSTSLTEIGQGRQMVVDISLKRAGDPDLTPPPPLPYPSSPLAGRSGGGHQPQTRWSPPPPGALYLQIRRICPLTFGHMEHENTHNLWPICIYPRGVSIALEN